MDAADDLVRRMTRLIQSNRASSLFVNGAPGTGKSYQLSQLREQPPADIPRCMVLGPYAISWNDVAILGTLVMRDCFDSGFLDTMPDQHTCATIHDTWDWFSNSGVTNDQQTFVVLIELIECDHPNLPTMTALFSSIRHLGAIWENRHVRLHHLVAGCWDPIALSEWYDRAGVSFPYAPGDNYFVWEGISTRDTQLLGHTVWLEQAKPYHTDLLHELTGGHAAAIVEILDRLHNESPSIERILVAAAESAERGDAGQALVNRWKQLTPEALSVLHDLILKRRIIVSCNQHIVDALIAMRLVKRQLVGTESYLCFPSWYVELLVRYHLSELGINDPSLSRVSADELVPEVTAINRTAYSLIYGIENMVRNFVTVQLMRQATTKEHFLQDHVNRVDERTQQVKDIRQRSIEWRNRSIARNMPARLNPILTYSSTLDLAELVEEIGGELRSPEWQRIAQALRDLAPVRDAVMHNQLINDTSLERLEALKINIHHALSATD